MAIGTKQRAKPPSSPFPHLSNETKSNPVFTVSDKMPIYDKLDYTPQTSSLNNIQFQSETLNIIAASILATFILSNIGSIISKLIFCTPPTTFRYFSWLRAFIFTNSDDPLRLLSWLRRKYVYRDSKCSRHPARLRPQRLLIPLLARGILLLATITSILISLPRRTTMSACGNGDYGLVWDESKVSVPENQDVLTTCERIPLETQLGEVRTSAEFCRVFSPTAFPNRGGPPGLTIVSVVYNVSQGTITTALLSRQHFWIHQLNVVWKNPTPRNEVFQSAIDELDRRAHLNISIRAIQDVSKSCDDVSIIEIQNLLSANMRCDITGEAGEDITDITALKPYLEQLDVYLLTGLQLRKFDGVQRRRRLSAQGSGFEEHSECPVRVDVIQPFVNIVALAILLSILFFLNMLVAHYTSRKGNALDAVFHIVKEALRHDSTTNPLEDNGKDEIVRLELRKWRCPTTGEGHVGFIGLEGDDPVDDFDSSVIVGAGGRVRENMAPLRALEKVGEELP